MFAIMYSLLKFYNFSKFQGQANPGGGPPYPLPRSASGRALLKGALARGHVKRSKCKGKNGKKGGKDTLDLIVTIDLVSKYTILFSTRCKKLKLNILFSLASV